MSFHSATQINTEYSLTQFNPKNDPSLVIEKEMKDRYLLQDTSPYVVSLHLTKGQSWLEPKNLVWLDSVTESLYEIENIAEVVSINTVPISIVSERKLSVGSISDIADKSKVFNNSFLVPNLISRQGDKAALFIVPREISSEAQKVLYKDIQASLVEPPAGATIRVGGAAAARTSMSKILESEILFFALASLLLSALLLALVFKGFVHSGLCIVMTLLVNVFAVGVLSALGISFTVLSNTLPIITTITTLALITHTLMSFSHRKTGADKRADIAATFTDLFEPHLLTALTTVIGFATLIPSQVPIISDFGFSVCLAVSIATLLTLVILPVFLMVLPAPERRSWKLSFRKHFDTVLAFRGFTVAGIGATVILFFFVGQNLNWSSKIFDDLPKDNESYINTLFIDDNHGGTVAFHLDIAKAGQANFWKGRDSLRRLALLQEEVARIPGVGSIIGLGDFVRSSTLNNRIPEDERSLAEIFFIFGMSADNPLDQFVTPNFDHTRLAIRLQDIPSEQMLEVTTQIKSLANQQFPTAEIQASGMAESLHRVNRLLAEELIFGFFYALAWILLLLTFVYRSLGLSLLSAVPNLVPPSLLLGTLALTETPIKPSIAIIFAISLGIAFDNTVYLLSKLKGKSIESRHDLSQIFSEEAGACFLSSLSLAIGFSTFLLSSFTMNVTFGFFMIVSILAGLVGDLVLLPALVGLRPRLLNISLFRGIILPMKRGRSMKPIVSKIATSLLLVAALTFVYQEVQAAQKLSAQSILKKVQDNNIVSNESLEMQMLIKERDGSTKERKLVIKKKNGKEKRALIKLRKPADLKGVGLLSVSDSSDSESQWLFLPSEKRSRRLSSSGKGGQFLDSDLSYEDMSISTYQNFTNTLEKVDKKDGREYAIIKSLVKDKEASSYGKIRTWVDVKTSQVLKANYYSQRGQLVKKILFKNYKKYGEVWRAHQVVVQNLKKKRSTTLKLENVSLKIISDGELSMNALEKI